MSSVHHLLLDGWVLARHARRSGYGGRCICSGALRGRRRHEIVRRRRGWRRNDRHGSGLLERSGEQFEFLLGGLALQPIAFDFSPECLELLEGSGFVETWTAGGGFGHTSKVNAWRRRVNGLRYVIGMLEPGEEAPDFELRSHRGGTVKLTDFRGRRNVVLAFHPLAFTPVCATQMSGYESDLAEFDRAGAAVLGISVDAQPSKAAWARTLGPISFDLLSDFHPHGGVAEKYGVYRAADGISERAIFLVDKSGRIAWAKVYPIPELPKNREVLDALRGLA
jgi:peroxiredoxin